MKLHHLISYIFHPVLVPVISTLLYFIIIPKFIPREFAYRIIAVIFVMTYIVPILLLYFLKKLNLIEDYQLPSIQERKFPLLFIATICFLIGKLLLNTNTVDLLALSFFACTLAIGIVYLLFYKNIKTSLHTTGISGLITFIAIISYHYKFNLLLLLISLFVLLGIVSTSRLKLEAHKMNEIFIGMLIGCLSQLLVYCYHLQF